MKHFLILSVALWLSGVAHAGTIVIHTTEGDFREVREFVDMAITDQGLVINTVAHIGSMLERTALEMPDAKPIYRHAEAVEFCSAVISRAMMEADPHNITYCPYVIAVYELIDQPGTIHVSYRRPTVGAEASTATREAMARVEALLERIATEATAF